VGAGRNLSKVPFHPYYTIKDLLGFTITLLLLAIVILWFPYIFLEPENFIPANPLATPLHIKPE
jgi:ubiquinol-cytochrome c reductase cytochrome b subunit